MFLLLYLKQNETGELKHQSRVMHTNVSVGITQWWDQSRHFAVNHAEWRKSTQIKLWPLVYHKWQGQRLCQHRTSELLIFGPKSLIHFLALWSDHKISKRFNATIPDKNDSIFWVFKNSSAFLTSTEVIREPNKPYVAMALKTHSVNIFMHPESVSAVPNIITFGICLINSKRSHCHQACVPLLDGRGDNN